MTDSEMKLSEVDEKSKTDIEILKKRFRLAKRAYLIPLILLGLFIIDSFTVNKTEMVFLVLSIISLLPVGIFGLIQTEIGFSIAKNNKLPAEKDIGYLLRIIGILYLIIGVLGASLLISMMHET